MRNLEERIAEFRSILKHMHDIALAYRDRAMKADARVDQLQMENRRQGDLIESLRNELGQKSGEIANLIRLNQEWQDKCHKLEADHDGLIRERDALKYANEEWIKKYDVLAVSAGSQYDKLEAQNNTLKVVGEIINLKKHRETYANKLKELEGREQDLKIKEQDWNKKDLEQRQYEEILKKRKDELEKKEKALTLERRSWETQKKGIYNQEHASQKAETHTNSATSPERPKEYEPGWRDTSSGSGNSHNSSVSFTERKQDDFQRAVRLDSDYRQSSAARNGEYVEARDSQSSLDSWQKRGKIVDRHEMPPSSRLTPANGEDQDLNPFSQKNPYSAASHKPQTAADRLASPDMEQADVYKNGKDYRGDSDFWSKRSVSSSEDGQASHTSRDSEGRGAF